MAFISSGGGIDSNRCALLLFSRTATHSESFTATLCCLLADVSNWLLFMMLQKVGNQLNETEHLHHSCCKHASHRNVMQPLLVTLLQVTMSPKKSKTGLRQRQCTRFEPCLVQTQQLVSHSRTCTVHEPGSRTALET